MTDPPPRWLPFTIKSSPPGRCQSGDRTQGAGTNRVAGAHPRVAKISRIGTFSPTLFVCYTFRLRWYPLPLMYSSWARAAPRHRLGNKHSRHRDNACLAGCCPAPLAALAQSGRQQGRGAGRQFAQDIASILDDWPEGNGGHPTPGTLSPAPLIRVTRENATVATRTPVRLIYFSRCIF